MPNIDPTPPPVDPQHPSEKERAKAKEWRQIVLLIIVPFALLFASWIVFVALCSPFIGNGK